MTIRLQIRKDTLARWASLNPTLALGEPALETDTNKLKFGDGVTSWNALPYFAPGGGGGAVASVAGRTGAVTLGEGDISNLTADLNALTNAISTVTGKALVFSLIFGD